MTVVASQDDEAGRRHVGTQTVSSDRTAPTVTGVSATAATVRTGSAP